MLLDPVYELLLSVELMIEKINLEKEFEEGRKKPATMNDKEDDNNDDGDYGVDDSDVQMMMILVMVYVGDVIRFWACGNFG